MRAHLAATYQTGDPDEAMVEIPSAVCATCGGIIDPLVGKVHEGTTIRWDVWVQGNYEHRNRPSGAPHPAVPWTYENLTQGENLSQGLTRVTASI